MEAGMALIEGKKRADILYGTEDNDTIYGYGGDDYLSSSGSASQQDSDRLYGGDGNDIIYAAGAATFSVTNDPAYDLNWAENAYAARAHVLDGGAGNDYISTGGSVGAVDGGDGYDVLEFGEIVQISGGGRVEVGYVEWSLTGMAVDLGAGTATFAGATTTIRFYTDRDNTNQTVLHTTVPPANFGAFTQSIAGIEAVVGEVGQRLLQVAALTAQRLHLVAGRRTGGVASKALLARFEEFLRPAIIKALGDPFTAADRGNAVFSTQAFQHNADFVLCRVMLARGAADVLDRLLGRRGLRPGFLSHLRFL
jgi:hypothetical protein